MEELLLEEKSENISQKKEENELISLMYFN
jgi:hypothetical protein